MRRKCERGRGNINADGAGAEVFVGDGCSQGASFGPMVAISRRGQGGRIYNNTRTRERLRRKCVKPADLTTHSPPKACSRPRTATRPSRALPLPHAAPTPARRPHHPFPTEDLLLPPHTSAPPRSPDAHPPTARCIPRRPHNTFPAEDLLPPPHNDTPCPSTFSLPPRPDAHPQAARCIPRRPHNTFPVEDLLPPPHNDAPFPCPPATSPQPRRTPADLTTHSSPKPVTRPRTATRPSPSVPLRAQKNGTAQWMCDAECLGRPSLRSVIGVGEPRAVRRRCGALAWCVELRLQPWALRSRRCGRVLRA